VIGLKEAVEQQNMRYGKNITHFDEQAGGQVWWVDGGGGGSRRISGEQGMGYV